MPSSRYRQLSQLAANPASSAVEVISALRSLCLQPSYFLFEKILTHFYTHLASLRPGSTAYDIGAHHGMHSVPLARLFSRVISVEPLPAQFSHLQEVMAPYPHAILQRMALSQQPGRATFVVNQGSLSESGLRQRIYNDPATAQLSEIQVDVSTLDILHASYRPVGYIKLDAEGAEVDILRGGQALLRQDRPIVSVEYGRPSYSAYGLTGESLRQVAEAAGYQVWDIFGWNIHDPAIYARTMDHFYWDYFLIPSEDTSAARVMHQARQELMEKLPSYLELPPAPRPRLYTALFSHA